MQHLLASAYFSDSVTPALEPLLTKSLVTALSFLTVQGINAAVWVGERERETETESERESVCM